MTKIFRKFDKDNSQSINFQEFKFQSYLLGMSNVQKIKKSFKILDVNGTGELNLDSFSK